MIWRRVTWTLKGRTSYMSGLFISYTCGLLYLAKKDISPSLACKRLAVKRIRVRGVTVACTRSCWHEASLVDNLITSGWPTAGPKDPDAPRVRANIVSDVSRRALFFCVLSPSMCSSSKCGSIAQASLLREVRV